MGLSSSDYDPIFGEEDAARDLIHSKLAAWDGQVTSLVAILNELSTTLKEYPSLKENLLKDLLQRILPLIENIPGYTDIHQTGVILFLLGCVVGEFPDLGEPVRSQLIAQMVRLQIPYERRNPHGKLTVFLGTEQYV